MVKRAMCIYIYVYIYKTYMIIYTRHAYNTICILHVHTFDIELQSVARITRARNAQCDFHSATEEMTFFPFDKVTLSGTIVFK